MDAKKILQKIISSSSRTLVLFDLDSTLFNVSGRSALIMKALADEPHFRSKYPALAEKLKGLRFHPQDWGLRETFSRCGLEATVDFFHEVREYWQQHFFSNHFLHADVPYEGAVEYVNALEAAGVDLRYLTGRDAQNMKTGTIESLKQCGFPVSQIETRLIMKPVKGSQEDEDYKVSRISELRSQASSVWFFENEPVIINKVAESHPDINIVFLDTTHSRRAEVPPHLLRINGRYSP